MPRVGWASGLTDDRSPGSGEAQNAQTVPHTRALAAVIAASLVFVSGALSAVTHLTVTAPANVHSGTIYKIKFTGFAAGRDELVAFIGTPHSCALTPILELRYGLPDVNNVRGQFARTEEEAITAMASETDTSCAYLVNAATDRLLAAATTHTRVHVGPPRH
jgi:hypothetical protein